MNFVDRKGQKVADGTAAQDVAAFHQIADGIAATAVLVAGHAAESVPARAASSTGALADLAAGTDTVLGRVGSADLAFGQVTTGQIANLAVTGAKLETVATAGTTGDASHVAAVTIDTKGRVTSAASTAISINASAVSSGNLAQARLPVATTNAVLFGRAAGGYDSDPVIAIDSTNHRLGVNQSTPTHTLHVVGDIFTTTDVSVGNQLTVTDTSTLTGHVTASNGLAVNGAILTANGTGTAFAVTAGDADLQHNAHVGITLTVDGDIIGGSLAIGSTSITASVANFNGALGATTDIGAGRDLSAGRNLIVAGNIGVWGFGGFVSQPTVTGSRGGNAALASLLATLATYGFIIDGSS